MQNRYSRQILFPSIGPTGQEKIAAATVLVLGCGALGSAHAETLARAGVGTLRIVDRDFVEHSNLQRQTLFSEADARDRLPKAVAAARRIGEINSEVSVDPHVVDANNSNIESLIRGCDVVIDGSDNFEVRYLANDACVKLGVSWIYGAAVASYGTTMTIRPGVTPCLRCIFDEMPEAGSSPTCDTAGVIMPIITMISAMQTAEALKILVGDIDSLHGSLMQFDVWSGDLRRIRLGEPKDGCKTCRNRDFEFLTAESGDFSTVLCGRNAVQVSPRPTAIDLKSLGERLGNLGEVKQNEYLVRFKDSGLEITVFADARAIITGTDDVAAARAMYARFVGS